MPRGPRAQVWQQIRDGTRIIGQQNILAVRADMLTHPGEIAQRDMALG